MSYAESPYGRELALARSSALCWYNHEHYRHNIKKKKPWKFYGYGYTEYDRYFTSMLPVGGFVNFVESMQKEVAVIDVFAPSSFIRSLTNETAAVRCGVALALGDFRTQEEKDEDAKRRILQIENADIYSSKRWINQLKFHLSNYGKEKADLIVCAPFAGWNVVVENLEPSEPSLELMWLVTNRLWNLLDNDGFLFINYNDHDINCIDLPSEFQNWCDKLGRINSEIAYNNMGAIRLKKTAASPKTLPSMKPFIDTRQFLG